MLDKYKSKKNIVSHIRGFTLIELLVVFAIIGILILAVTSGLNNYNKTQVFQTGVLDVVDLLNEAKSNAQSQIKPNPQCNNKTLEGYQVVVVIHQPDFHMDAVCSGTAYVMESRKLPNQMAFNAGSTTTVFFSVLTGSIPAPAVIGIGGFSASMNQLINISTTSEISVP
jgi:prepilin-type N-terminal cleavage/methylation domain-containing protein